MTDERVPVAIYARYSTGRRDARSLDEQIRRCRALAASRGLEVPAEYSDAAQSLRPVEKIAALAKWCSTRSKRTGSAPARPAER